MRRLQQLVWGVTLVLAVALSIRIAPEQYRTETELSDWSPTEAAEFRAHLAEVGVSNTTLTILSVVSTAVGWVVGIGLAVLLLVRRKGADWMAFYLSLVFISGIGAVYPPDLRELTDHQPGWMIIGIVMTVLNITSLFLLPMIFPNGRFVPRWMAIVAAVYLVMAVSFIADPSSDVLGGVPIWVEGVTDLVLLVAIIGSLVYRYRWVSTPVQRQQMKWAAVGLAVAMPAFFITDAALRNIDGSPKGVVSMLVFVVGAPFFQAVFPICLTFAILRYRLFDIDLVISRTLVWVLMTLLVIAAYVGIVFGIGSLLDDDQTTLLSLIALGLTAVLFQPVRQRVQHGINRLLFGDRDDPYQVVRKLAAELADTVQPVEALRATVRALTEALRLPYAAITLEPGALPVAAAGVPGNAQVPIPLTYQSQPVGELIVSPRGGAREFDATDLRLLDDLSRQIGVVAHNVRLTNDLQLSRERIVTAREEERRRLRRDLHDGLGAQLSALTLQAGAMKTTIRTDPDAAIAQATELQQELRTAIADIRRLVQGLRPASLDDLGLIGALQNRIATVNLGEGSSAAGAPLVVTLDAPATLADLPAAVEVAIYRIVDEALTNIVRHAHASQATIRIERTPSAIRLVIEDNGLGIPPDRISGVGLQSMRERALELGGTFAIEPGDLSGTRIIAELPLAGPAS